MKYFTQIIILPLISLFILQGLGDVVYSQITYTPDATSRLWIEGRSNINEFECQANQYLGEAILFDSDDQVEFLQEDQERVFLKVKIKADGFDKS